MIISKYVDPEAMSAEEITDNFSSYLRQMDNSILTFEQYQLIKNLCEKYPILRILCRAMYITGYYDTKER